MGICGSIPNITKHAARVVARQSGLNKYIITTQYKNKSLEIIYDGDYPLYIIAIQTGKYDYTIQSTDIIDIYVVEGTNDILVETLADVIVLSASLGILQKPQLNLGNMGVMLNAPPLNMRDPYPRTL